MYDEGIRVRGNIKYVGVRIYTHTQTHSFSKRKIRS